MDESDESDCEIMRLSDDGDVEQFLVKRPKHGAKMGGR